VSSNLTPSASINRCEQLCFAHPCNFVRLM